MKLATEGNKVQEELKQQFKFKMDNRIYTLIAALVVIFGLFAILMSVYKKMGTKFY